LIGPEPLNGLLPFHGGHHNHDHRVDNSRVYIAGVITNILNVSRLFANDNCTPTLTPSKANNGAPSAQLGAYSARALHSKTKNNESSWLELQGSTAIEWSSTIFVSWPAFRSSALWLQNMVVYVQKLNVGASCCSACTNF